MVSLVAVKMLTGMNNALPHHTAGSKEKKPTYKKLEDGTIIIAQTGDKIGTYAHGGSPMPRERVCKIGGRLISYIPLGEPAAP